MAEAADGAPATPRDVQQRPSVDASVLSPLRIKELFSPSGKTTTTSVTSASGAVFRHTAGSRHKYHRVVQSPTVFGSPAGSVGGGGLPSISRTDLDHMQHDMHSRLQEMSSTLFSSLRDQDEARVRERTALMEHIQSVVHDAMGSRRGRSGGAGGSVEDETETVAFRERVKTRLDSFDSRLSEMEARLTKMTSDAAFRQEMTTIRQEFETRRDPQIFKLEQQVATLADRMDPLGSAAFGAVSRRDFKQLCDKVQKMLTHVNDHAATMEGRLQHHLQFERESMEGQQLQAEAIHLFRSEMASVVARVGKVEERSSRPETNLDVFELRRLLVDHEKLIGRIMSSITVLEEEVRALKRRLIHSLRVVNGTVDRRTVTYHDGVYDLQPPVSTSMSAAPPPPPHLTSSAPVVSASKSVNFSSRSSGGRGTTAASAAAAATTTTYTSTTSAAASMAPQFTTPQRHGRRPSSRPTSPLLRVAPVGTPPGFTPYDVAAISALIDS